MRFAIVGVGAVGGYFGGRLAQAGHEVLFIARGEHLRVLRESGLRVSSPKGDFTVHPARAEEVPPPGPPAEAILIAVKAWQVAEAARKLGPLVGPETLVLPLQNGVEAPDQLSAVLGGAHVLGGLCRILSTLEAPGHVRHLGAEPTLTFGELDRRRTARVERLREVLVGAGIAAEVPADIHAAMWEKFLFIAAFGGVGAVARAPIGVLRRVPETRRLLEASMRESLAVARARGISLEPEAVDRVMAYVDQLPAEGLASMQRDIFDGRPSELSSLTGAVVRLGREKGVATPVNDFLYASLLPQELQARGER